MRGLFASAVIVGSFFVLALVAVIIGLFTRSGSAPRKIEKFWMWLVVKSGGLKINTVGAENIPLDKAVVFASNHTSQLDIPVLYFALPVPFCFLVKKELLHIPLFGTIMRKMGHIPVDRSGGKAAMKSLKEAARSVKQGTSIVVFPEGTRSPDGKLLGFKPGVIMIALFAGSPVIPVAIRGTHTALPKGRLLIRPAEIEIKIGKPIDTVIDGRRRDKQELTREVEEKVAELLGRGGP